MGTQGIGGRIVQTHNCSQVLRSSAGRKQWVFQRFSHVTADTIVRLVPVHVPHWQVGWDMLQFKPSGPSVDHLSGSISVQLSKVVMGVGHDQSLQNNLFQEASWVHSWKWAHQEWQDLGSHRGWDLESLFSAKPSGMAGHSLGRNTFLTPWLSHCIIPSPQGLKRAAPRFQFINVSKVGLGSCHYRSRIYCESLKMIS